uniref:Uncharacterized protein n=1 Tax=Anguilla anguilla TaxID=7936 RepID=A0A0E9VPV5_ANGAN
MFSSTGLQWGWCLATVAG